jgi:hypothetical protein
MKRADPFIDRLLAQKDGLAVTEKEELFERIQAQLRVPLPRRVPGWTWPAVAAAASLILPVVYLSRPSSDLVARGGGSAVSVEIHCIPAAPDGTCATGRKLVFRALNAQGLKSMGALALNPQGTAVWYFPVTGSDTTVDLSQSGPGGLLQQAVVLGPEQPPGLWDVYLVLHQRPMTRAEVRAAVEHKRGAEALPVVLRRSLLVEAP